MPEKILELVADLENQPTRRIRYQPSSDGEGWWRWEAEAVVDDADPRDDSDWHHEGIEGVASLAINKLDAPAACHADRERRIRTDGAGEQRTHCADCGRHVAGAAVHAPGCPQRDADPLDALDERLEAALHEIDHGADEDVRREVRQARQLVEAVDEHRST
jgi:hypothetical protein